jgi:hypothetical protein
MGGRKTKDSELHSSRNFAVQSALNLLVKVIFLITVVPKCLKCATFSK